MPARWLTESEQNRLTRFPETVSETDLVTFFTLTKDDRREIGKLRGDSNRIGFALQLCALRYLGFIPDDLSAIPFDVVDFLANQLSSQAKHIFEYGSRSQTRTDHLTDIEKYLGFHKMTSAEEADIDEWLTVRAVEHDRPLLLLQILCERLQTRKITRPGLSILERFVTKARNNAREMTWETVSHLVTDETKIVLDTLLNVDEDLKRTPLNWLRTGATSSSANSILQILEKILYLRRTGVENWNLEILNPNLLKRLNRIGRTSTNQMLERMSPENRYPILLAFLHQTLIETIDEAIDLFDRYLMTAYSRAGRELDEFRRSVAKSTNEKVRLFQTVGSILINDEVPDEQIRRLVYELISPENLRFAVEECEQIMRPLDDSYFDLLATRYGNLRQFAPYFLETFDWRSGNEQNELTDAIEIMRMLNSTGQRKIPDDAPAEFIPKKWKPYVITEEYELNRRYYELCLLWQMREALRSGNLWVTGSRRYNNPESYLIPPPNWNELRAEACSLMKIPTEPMERLGYKENDFRFAALSLENQLAGQGAVRIENGGLVITPLEAGERPASSEFLEEVILERMPQIDLPELLIEVDSWTRFSKSFKHSGGGETRKTNLLSTLYASILAQSGNFGLTQMSRMTDFSYHELLWTTNWYLREETLRDATTKLVNFHYHLPLSQYVGDGTVSSSDGQRFPVAVRTANATALPKYFGYGKGLTFYTWTSDQYSQFGTKVIPATMRDATVVLDEILDNETELPLGQHSTDTAGYTEIIFALFDLLGLQFAPRIRDLTDQTLYRVEKFADTPHVNKLLKGKINPDLFVNQWDDLLRLAGSMKLGWVTASLLIKKFHSMPKQNDLVKSLQEYGRMIKTIFILRYLASEDYRRQINTQLNKGELLHALRRYLFIANEAQIRKRQPDEQLNQAACLNLVTNAVVVWNTVYMWEVIKQLQAEGFNINEEDLKHISPARYEHINVYGKYSFPVGETLNLQDLRELRKSSIL
jgi:TnpA family transposase